VVFRGEGGCDAECVGARVRVVSSMCEMREEHGGVCVTKDGLGVSGVRWLRCKGLTCVTWLWTARSLAFF
jgi:hypothetical protein